MVSKGAKLVCRDALVLLSAGLDSTVTLALADAMGFRCETVTFDYGQANRVELEVARHNAERYGSRKHHEVTLPTEAFAGKGAAGDDARKGSGYVPLRNVVFMSYAAALAEAHTLRYLFVGIVSLDGRRLGPKGFNGFGDTSLEFLTAFSDVLEATCTHPTSVMAPLADTTKAGVIKLARKLGVDPELTMSCYQPDGYTPCGVCLPCQQRKWAFRDLKREELEGLG